MNIDKTKSLIEHFCIREDLSTYDPYDIWKTKLGLKVKKFYNRNKYIALIPAGILTISDLLFNRLLRFFYQKQEFPITRAQAAQVLLNLNKNYPDKKYIRFAKKHIDWLLQNYCTGYAGLCWGLGFTWPAEKNTIYSANTPFTTHTPYVLEAIHEYIRQTGDNSYVEYIRSIYNYYEKDVAVMYETESALGISYGPMKDRLITNAVSYTMFAYAIFYQYIAEERENIRSKIEKLYLFICENQMKDGEWIYEPFNKESFIDCFHSCFVIKNIFKTNQLYPLSACTEVMENGYKYIRDNFYSEQTGLVHRFSKKNKPSVVKYDLYDNAEFLSISIFMEDRNKLQKLNRDISKNFTSRGNIYSMIDILGVRRNKNTLRWAVVPYLFAMSKCISTNN